MAGFADLVPLAQPVLVGDYAFDMEATQGADWRWAFTGVVDEDDLPVDLDASATVIGTCELLTAVGGTVVATLVFDGFADGSFVLSLEDATTATVDPGTYVHHLRVTDGTSVVQFWGPSNTTFTVLPD